MNGNDNSYHLTIHNDNKKGMIDLNIINLTAMDNNEVGKIEEINKCGHAQKRLHELGLYKDAEIKMLKNDRGPVIFSLSGCKLALGRNLASNIKISV